MSVSQSFFYGVQVDLLELHEFVAKDLEDDPEGFYDTMWTMHKWLQRQVPMLWVATRSLTTRVVVGVQMSCQQDETAVDTIPKPSAEVVRMWHEAIGGTDLEAYLLAHDMRAELRIMCRPQPT